ncbi:MAG: hypothetical protein AB8F74_19290, partial [Saprospiraceae bacterium]
MSASTQGVKTPEWWGQRVRNRHKEDAGILRRTIIDFNKLNNYEQIQLDYLDELPPMADTLNPSCLITRRPCQFGLRGDEPLWDHLGQHFKLLKFPRTEDELTTQIHDGIEKLTQFR